MILVVEDDTDVREMLEFAFRSNGFSVFAAADGTTALAVIERERPCLVILDLIMPRMGGLQMLTQLRERHAGNDVPVCVISALESAVPGTVASFTKPFDIRELVAVAARYCTHSRASA